MSVNEELGEKRILREEPHFPFALLLPDFYDFLVLMGKIRILLFPYKDLAQMLERCKLGILLFVCFRFVLFIYLNKFWKHLAKDFPAHSWNVE